MSNLDIVLPEVTLAAIVRDELMNPAGGIVDFVDSTVPYVKEAVIVDTGSVDGTKEELEKLSQKYRKLRVYHKRFFGFDNARNFSLEQVRTGKVLILDADERLTHQDFCHLYSILCEHPYDGYYFGFLGIFPDGFERDQIGSSLRLFCSYIGIKYFFAKTEDYHESKKWKTYPTKINIKHFQPSLEALQYKEIEFYEKIPKHPNRRERVEISNIQLSKLHHFKNWKRYNPEREKYR